MKYSQKLNQNGQKTQANCKKTQAKSWKTQESGNSSFNWLAEIGQKKKPDVSIICLTMKLQKVNNVMT